MRIVAFSWLCVSASYVRIVIENVDIRVMPISVENKLYLMSRVTLIDANNDADVYVSFSFGDHNYPFVLNCIVSLQPQIKSKKSLIRKVSSSVGSLHVAF